MKFLRGLALGATAVVVSGLAAGSASAAGGDEVPDGTYAFAARVEVGAQPNAQACSGALVAPQWVITARSCFGPGPVQLGVPARDTTVTVGRTDLTGTGGHVAPVVWLVPHPDRDVVLARLATPATGVTPVRAAVTAPVAGETLQAAGYGRTRTEWVPNRLHAADFVVGDVTAATAAVSPAAGGVICKGDAGGPALRQTSTGPELVGLHYESAAGGCLGSTGSDAGAVETRVDVLAGWIRQTTVADVQIYGALPDGRLTFSVIESASGDRLTTVTSTAALGFTPRAVAALNQNTLLVTSEQNALYRVDITGNNPALSFAAPVQLAPSGWSHRLLSFDGDGTLFGIAGNFMRRYTVTSAKPGPAQIINNNLVIPDGLGSIQTLAATGPDYVIGSTSAGVVRAYRLPRLTTWVGATLTTNSVWAGFTAVVSPGRGLYYGRTAAGGLQRFSDPTPNDLNGAGLVSYPNDPVDTAGWTMSMLAAVPFDANPQSPVDTSIFGLTSDKRLTYTAIDSVTGDRDGPTVVSAATLPFTPGTLATLNYNTLLVTDTTTSFNLYRVDIIATKPALLFAPPVKIAAGWSHRLLTFDGNDTLYGIAGSTLRRYRLTKAKPVAGDITDNVQVGTGFTQTTLAAPLLGHVLGTTSDGRLLSYPISREGEWSPAQVLAASGWNYASLVSPGNGDYFVRTSAGALLRFKDADPDNGSGTDIRSFPDDPVDTAGWNQIALSAQPYIS
ncbi:trypsin-like serine protease [Actinoplanes sp. Pm04-4]|uniref:Trypsin-like serine protease n=1 Tax=Paractinoplanes pyxinae TaxID=2997416 RepID=A0ABT4BAS6_9ACTN|nr:trypsin-like serine protease [Actinoplanes pyxinae]MCY1143609.1 trypsin-like serine protease [Actinoplanes pyxinae]